MPDSSVGTAAFLSGQEIVNDARTLAYLQNGYGPSSLNISGCCTCPRIQELIECNQQEPYTTPISDPAPWYDASVPESADFGGFLVTAFEGMGSTYIRTASDKVTGGAVLGRLRPAPRLMTWKGFLFGRSDCAVQYGLSWMTANLVGTNCNCEGEELDLLVCCPELIIEDEDPPVSGACGLPPIVKPDPCPPFAQPEAFRQLKNVALVEGPKVLSQRRVGCNTCDSPSCEGDTLIIEIEFSLMAGNPYMYGCPVCLCTEQSFPIFTEADCVGTWQKWTQPQIDLLYATRAVVGDDSLIVCEPPECDPPFDCTETDSECGRPDLPDLVPFTDGCFCDAMQPVNFCCSIPADSFGQFFDGAPTIEIASGSSAMRSTTIRFYSNLTGQDCCETSIDPCRNCDSLQIRYIPANSVMTIDGTTRTISVSCSGGPSIRAEHLTVTPFAWPSLSCIDFCICVESEGLAVASDATVSVLITPREM